VELAMFRSLQVQIIIVVVALLTVLFIQIVLSRDNQQLLLNNQALTGHSAAEFALVYKLERDVVDLQRNVLVFKNNESASVVRRFEDLVVSVDEKLNSFEMLEQAHSSTENYQASIQRMRGHLESYKDNFSDAVAIRARINALYEIKIDEGFAEFIALIELLERSADNSAHSANTAMMKYHLALAKNHSYQYLTSQQYDLGEPFDRELDVVDHMVVVSLDGNEKLREKIKAIRSGFFQLTQVTRSYVFLTNVVMAGAASEFLYLTKAITNLVTENKVATDSEVRRLTAEAKLNSDVAAFVSIALLLLAAIVLSLRIIVPIREITRVFTRLSAGEEIEEIPGISRSDEIGALSKAASVFQDKNKQTSALLNETQNMNAQLEILSRQANEASLAKGEFLASMSHEIRTPINGVMGMLGLLDRSELASQQRHFVNLAKSSSEALLTVINDILDFSKIEAGKLDLDIVDFDLLQFFCDFADANALAAQQKDLELILDLSELSIVRVRGDPIRLTQVLNNLLANAIKFTDHGEIIISVNLSPYEDELLLNCAIADTGVGIASDKIASLFEAFTQADASTTKKYGGSGLGLAISKQLCELMNGSISVSSKLDSGSCFAFSVTLGNSEHNQATLSDDDLKNANVLIVDGNSSNRSLLRRQLELWGAVCYEAANARAAKALVDSGQAQFTAVLICRQLSAGDSLSLVAEIRGSASYHNSRIIMMTGVDDRDSAKAYSDIGCSNTILKPVTPLSLHRVMTRVARNVGEYTAAGVVSADSPASTELELASHSRILLVDDNEINRQVALQMLQDLGYRTASAENGEEAIAALVEAPVDDPFQLILMDCQMPVMDGYQTTGQIRAAHSPVPNSAITIVAMTANAMKGDREKCLAAGMDDYLPKPVNIDHLRERLLYWLDQAAVATTAIGEAATVDTATVLVAEQLVWDKAQALSRMGGREDRLQAVVELFAPETSGYIDALQRELDEEDFQALGRTLHALKGVVATIGGSRLRALSETVEQSASQGDKRAVVEKIPQLLVEYQLLLDELHRYQQPSVRPG